ncbi:DeoR family transcriptional regulator [Rhodovulum bhavnagarense]|uniref:DeoR family transcriptional regulator n=1 Tax=Rhodovulum bhavnagarense TaxID=992286 RepID=A0A4R2R8S5_9RHOB|nr:DeoR/GlpR family DNA-binding transcription regulator [Rhodovulum bhavnagarense]TCP58428.1 DeoR family transcriptional regulator [Rhodovulum bhavnagarense]
MTLQPAKTPLSERQASILSKVTENGYVTIEALAAQFGVSAQTVRRDIIALSSAGHLQRFHGGAGPVAATEAARLDYPAKKAIGRPEKAAVGSKAAAMIPDGATVYLDVGTTVEACAVALSRRPGFTILTNSMPAAMMFDPAEHRVFVLGNRMAGRDGSLVGEDSTRILGKVTLDVAMIACSAIEDTGRVMDFDIEKIAIKRAAMDVAKSSCLLATLSKFNRTALATIARIEQFDDIVTEAD